MEVKTAMNEDFRAKLLKTYGICCIIRQPASSNLRNIAKIIDTQQSDRECIKALKEYLLLCGISVGGVDLDFCG